MSAIAFLRQLLEDGLDLAAALTAADRFEQRAAAAETARIAERRAKDAARKQANRAQQRTQMSRDVTRCHADMAESRGPSPHVGEPAPVVTPSLPSLRSEEVRTPISPDGEMRPKAQSASRFAKPNGFARFWESYPSKVGKPVAEKAYARALKRIPGPDPPGVILAAIERARKGRKWLDGIIPNPSTWLNQDRWLDEPAEVISLHGKPHERFHPDKRATAYVERLGDIDAAMAAAVQQRGGSG